jgi:hypothetical protein
MTTVTFDLAKTQDAINEAGIQARTAAKQMLAQRGDGPMCGFAWVDVRGVRSNSKMGKALAAAGFSKAWNGALQLWNPSQAHVQCVDILEAGAHAYATVLRDKLGLNAYAGSRLD